jgi:two-component system phosphate regulon sensor histidine kinase PhoR
MRRQALRMESLIGDLLKLARIESGLGQGRQEMLDVPAILEATLAEGRALSDGNHRIDGEVEPGLMLYGRELEARSVFTNLLANAVQYTPKGGAIQVCWRTDGAGAVFTVRDNGIGVAPADLPRLTERFYRVDVARSRFGGGTGLGLSIVKHALANLDGELRIDSALGSGSTFTCIFPPHRVNRSGTELPIAVPR